jgi:osmotically-inducible protein OsmY
MADRNRYNRGGRSRREADDRSWRDQEEQFSNDRSQPDYDEGYGYQMSEPHGGQAQRQGQYETGWDRDSRYGQRGSGYGAAAERGYGPARYAQPGYRFDSFTTEDQNGGDFTKPTTRYYGYGGYGAYSSPYGFGGSYAGDRARSDYRDRNRRDWWDRTSDEVMSWFGDEEAARRRRHDHSGRGPTNYTRSDERIREDVNDNLTDDWGVDASEITVAVENGDVTLEGTVATRLQKRRAEDCAEDVSGVKNVQNNLRVKERSQRSAWDRNERDTESGV